MPWLWGTTVGVVEDLLKVNSAAPPVLDQTHLVLTPTSTHSGLLVVQETRIDLRTLKEYLNPFFCVRFSKLK
jgi:hypothetical protein